MRILDRMTNGGSARMAREPSDARPAVTPVPAAGTYLTDGGALYRVAHLLLDGASGEPFLELEDCSTLELVLCPVRTASGLRSVTPIAV